MVQQSVPVHEAKVGDVVEVVGHSVGDAPRAGEILEVSDGERGLRLLVRWENGHESVLYPGSDVAIHRFKRPAKTAKHTAKR
jgi:Domain of unknown function (DUF1918)